MEAMLHGYDSYIAVLLMSYFAGLGIPDEVNKIIQVKPHLYNLSWAMAHTQTSSGIVSVSWKKDRNTYELSVNVPEGFIVELSLPHEILGWDCLMESDEGIKPIEPLCMHMGGITESFTVRAKKLIRQRCQK